MFKWSVKATLVKPVIEEGDWGKDVVSALDGHLYLVNEVILTQNKQKVIIKPKSGVVKVLGGYKLVLGVNIGGYCYSLDGECISNIIEMAPFTTAILDISSHNTHIVDRHFYMKYEITEIFDKATRRMSKLKTPIHKEFIIKLLDDCIVIS